MIHDIEQVRSLKNFISENRDEKMTNDELFNTWMQSVSFSIRDADTVDYYMALIPLIERRLAIK